MGQGRNRAGDTCTRGVPTMRFVILLAILFALVAAGMLPHEAAAQSLPEPAISPLPVPTGSSSPGVQGTGSPVPDVTPPAPSPVLPTLLSPAPPGQESPEAIPGITSLIEDIFTRPVPFKPAGSSKISSAERLRLITRRLEMVKARMAREEMPLTISIEGGTTMIRAGDIILMTVMNEDLPEYNLATLSPGERTELEQEFAQKVLRGFEASLKRYRKMSAPGYLHAAMVIAAVIIAITLVLNFAIRKLCPRTAIRWFVRLCLWTFSLVMILLLFPLTRGTVFLLSDLVIIPLVMLWGVILGATFIDPVLQFLAAKDIEGLRALGRFRGPRENERVETLREASRYAMRALVILMASVGYLWLLKVNLTTIAAFAGGIGVIVSFIGQDYIRDIISGLIIVMEDQFGVGDIIESPPYGGVVEGFSLRSTRLRDIKGALCTVPNGLLRGVRNLSHNYAQVDFRVQVSYLADMDMALRVLKEEADLLRESMPGDIIEEPVPACVDSLGESAVEIRMFIKTRPKMQWQVERELNRRIKQRFDKEGIQIPFRQLEVRILKDPPAAGEQGEPPPS